jgi:16S rRNA (adenine1518-N6/adenine1519-N6)-dimethyltransferase
LARIDDLPPLREVIARHGLDARRALGQNFLLDLNLTSRIARSGGDLSGLAVVEVGPGPGGLTRGLLAAGADRVIAIERDERCRPALEEIAGRYPGRLDIVMGDALEVDPRPRLAGQAAVIVANLPYNVATPLIVGWIKSEPWPAWFRSITVMVQKEFADRLSATPAERKDYGRLSVLTQWRMRARTLFDVPPQAFTPQPKVMSSVVSLTPLAESLRIDAEVIERLTQAAFGQRRKMLRQSLKGLGGVEGLLAAAGLKPEMRAEEASVAQFLAMAQALEARGRGPSADDP